MGLEARLKTLGAMWLTSHMRVRLRRFRHTIKRVFRRRPHEITYFHRLDDPYCQLMVQILPEFAERFNVKIVPKVVELLPANMYPDPARYEAYGVVDANRLARLYGLGFPSSALIPDRLAVGMAHRYLASIENDPDFFSVAEEIGAALWQRNYPYVQELSGSAEFDDSKLRANETLLQSLGHYASASLYYDGEFYPGPDRLYHLEERLNESGLGDGQVHYGLQQDWRSEITQLGKSIAGRNVEVFFSVRSPYSYLGLELIAEFAAVTDVHIRLRPVLPMMMRGMKVPPTKRMYIISDVAREAKAYDIPFGMVNDPLGLATERAMAIGFAALKEGYGLDFFRAFTRGVWAEGIDGASDRGLVRILENAGLSKNWLDSALPDEEWRKLAEENREEMFKAGSWGVPTFTAAGSTFWGQDRIWALLEKLRQSAI